MNLGEAIMYGCPYTEWTPKTPINPIIVSDNIIYDNMFNHFDKIPIILAFLDGYISALEQQNIDATQAKAIRDKIKTL